MVKLHTTFATELRNVIKRLDLSSKEFEKEVQLASVQKDVQRHEEVMAALRPDTGCLTNIIFPRNVKFTGRNDVLQSLHSNFEPSLAPELRDRKATSCLVHAVGGMGKTETALEYTYKYRHSYSYIFWLRAESKQILLESFMDVVYMLELMKDDSLSQNMKLRIGLQWFQRIGKGITLKNGNR
jgi:hypothetical protein